MSSWSANTDYVLIEKCFALLHIAIMFQVSHDVKIKNSDGLVYDVEGSTGCSYTINIGEPSCTCYDWRRFLLPCKHMMVVLNSRAEVWRSLPSSYRNNVFLLLDLPDVPVTDIVTDDSSEIPHSEEIGLNIPQSEEILTEDPQCEAPLVQDTPSGQSIDKYRYSISKQLDRLKGAVYLTNDVSQLKCTLETLTSLEKLLSCQLQRSHEGLPIYPRSLKTKRGRLNLKRKRGRLTQIPVRRRKKRKRGHLKSFGLGRLFFNLTNLLLSQW